MIAVMGIALRVLVFLALSAVSSAVLAVPYLQIH